MPRVRAGQLPKKAPPYPFAQQSSTKVKKKEGKRKTYSPLSSDYSEPPFSHLHIMPRALLPPFLARLEEGNHALPLHIAISHRERPLFIFFILSGEYQ